MDLKRQERLRKKVTDLERKLERTRKELDDALAQSIHAPASAMSLSSGLSNSKSPASELAYADNGKRKAAGSEDCASLDGSTPVPVYKKARKSPSSVSAYTTSDDIDRETPTKKLRKKRSTRSTRTSKSSQSRRENHNVNNGVGITIVPDGDIVPPVPSIPSGVKGKVATVSLGDDGYGGLSHEIF
jgi:hypothetical protein